MTEMRSVVKGGRADLIFIHVVSKKVYSRVLVNAELVNGEDVRTTSS